MTRPACCSGRAHQQVAHRRCAHEQVDRRLQQGDLTPAARHAHHRLAQPACSQGSKSKHPSFHVALVWRLCLCRGKGPHSSPTGSRRNGEWVRKKREKHNKLENDQGPPGPLSAVRGPPRAASRMASHSSVAVGVVCPPSPRPAIIARPKKASACVARRSARVTSGDIREISNKGCVSLSVSSMVVAPWSAPCSLFVCRFN